LLVGLDIGPNLFVTGSLSAFLWPRAARQAGAEPSIRHSAALGIVAAPLAMAGAVGVLAAGSLH
jgi:arsenical pump membrane protein